jgi:hypothetical protein
MGMGSGMMGMSGMMYGGKMKKGMMS